MKLPAHISKIVEGLAFVEDKIGRSYNQTYIFEDKYVLKISSDINSLKREKERNDWLLDKLPVPKSIAFIEECDKAFYLKSFIKGEMLINEKTKENPELLVNILGQAVRLLKSLDQCDCPFNSLDNEGNSFVHGDFCLPNILIGENNQIVGFVDLDNCGLGDPWYDYAWALWSLEYNLGTKKYNNLFLKEIDLVFDEEKYNMYIPKEYRKND